jgi:hypothetical protein
MVQVVNDGPQGHELSVVRVAPGRTAAEIQQFFSVPPTGAPPTGPPPFSAWEGGINALSKDLSGVATLDLPAGEYAAICLVPDPASGIPHTALGMVTGFTAR